MEKMDKLLNYLQEIADNCYISSLMHWEMDIVAPKKSIDYLINVKTKVETKTFELATNKEYKKLLDDVINSKEYDSLSIEEQRYIKELQEEYEKDERVPSNFYEEYSELRSKANAIWVEAKRQKDYDIFKPYLEKIIDMTKKYYEYRYPNATNLYDCMLNEYETDMTSEIIDKLFADLKKELIPIIKQLKPVKEQETKQEHTNEELIKIAKYILNYIGFDNDRGTLGIFPHGYTCKLTNDDIRITLSDNKNIIDFVTTVIHEGGHGIFEQSVGENLSKFPIYGVGKFALHESQSRFYENILGRNINFWKPIYDEIKQDMKLEISLEEFIKILNQAQPSFIRTQADELTYCLHIILRYEIEKDLFDGKITVEELPRIWNEKTKEYLGLEVQNNADGILQDVHWSQGNFGYFPSYLIGSILDGMLMKNIEENLGNINELLASGKITEITNYLKENIHKYGGTYTINELTKRLCRKELTVEPLIEYFKEKYMN